MRRSVIAAAGLALLVLGPLPGQAQDSYSVVMAGSRCASASAAQEGAFSAAWVCTGVQVAGSETTAPDPERSQRAFGCIAVAKFRAGKVQRACGPVPDDALDADPTLQESKIDFYLIRGGKMLAARITLTGYGPYLNDHVLSELGGGDSEAEHYTRVFGLARVYRSATLSGFIVGDGIGGQIRGNRGSMSTGVAGAGTIDAD